MTQTPAGWHPAPDHPGQLRYWDGASWTDHYAPAGTPPAAAPTKRSRVGLWIALGAIAVLLVGCIAVLGSSGGDSEPERDVASDTDSENEPDPNDPDVVGDEIGAQIVCEDFVEDRLKSPSTAEFSDEDVKQIKGPTWLVTGAVDSENSFGAEIRNNYACRVRFTGDDNWRLIELTGLTN